jgi:gas vesicle protein
MTHKTMMLLGGTVLGAGLALLYAPQSGEKSRKRMRKFGKQMSNRSDRMLRNLADFSEMVSGSANKMARMWH